MQKLSRWFFAITGGLALLLTALYGFARMQGPDKEQKAALELLDKTTPVQGRNAFALLWSLDYDVPESERERLLARDVRRFENTSDAAGTEPFDSIVGKRYPGPHGTQDHNRYCKWRERNCLSRIRAEPEAYARLLETDAALIARADSLSAYGHVRNPFPYRSGMPLLPYRSLAYPLTRHAHSFTTGEVDSALDGACRGMSAGRMLIRSDDSLIGSQLGAAMFEGNAALLADMLAELPVHRPLPASCTAALAPPAQDEFSLCGAIRGEARYQFASTQAVASEGAAENALFPLFYDEDKTIARMAPKLAWFCGEQARSAIVGDTPAEASSKRSSQPLQCVANAIGCIFTDEGGPSFDAYQHRLQDAGMRLKVAATLSWLRERPAGQAIAERLAQRPAALRSPTRELQLSKDGASLSVELFDTREGPRWSVPLPASRLPVATAASSLPVTSPGT